MIEKTLQYRLQESLLRFENQLAIVYGEEHISYAELNRRSNYIAHLILNMNIDRETPVGILIEDRSEMIAAMLGIFKGGCVFVPLDSALPPERVKVLIRSVNIRIILGDECNLRRLNRAGLVGDQGEEFLVLESLYLNGDASRFNGKPECRYTPEDYIYIYFTSGTTGIPKALLGKNRSLLHFIDWELETFGIKEGFRVSQFTTPGFDAFLRDVLVPLLAGGVVCVPHQKDILLDAQELVKWINSLKINLIHCVPSLFRLLAVSRSNSNGRFKYLQSILLSGERINPVDVHNWFGIVDDGVDLVNLWGTSETTLAKTCYFIGPADMDKQRIPVGKPIRGARVIILDKNMNLCHQRTVGDIYIRTPYRTGGYCNDPELTQQRFIPNPFGRDHDDILHKTGDIGRILADGNLEVIGRTDRQVKIRGIRIELEEIESVLVGHPQVKEAVVVKREISESNELLCAFIVDPEGGSSNEELWIESIKRYLSEKLPGYMVPFSIRRIAELPRNPNGKVDYKRLPDSVEDKKGKKFSPRNEVERKLLTIWSQLLRIEKENIGPNRRFFELGGNSLNIMSLIMKIYTEFGVRLSLAEVFSNMTIETQVKIVEGKKKERRRGLEIAEEKTYYPVSSAQRRMFVLHRIEKNSITYNVPFMAVLVGVVDHEQVESIFRMLIKRHLCLRTSFPMIEGEPVQKISRVEDLKFRVERVKAAGKEIESAARRFVRPFDLGIAPLIRVGLITIGEKETLLIVDMHHIITDGTSMEIMVEEFMALINRKVLPPLKFQYKDYSEWWNSNNQRSSLKSQEAYWLQIFEERVPELNLAADFSAPRVRDPRGCRLDFSLNSCESDGLMILIGEEEVTLFMALLSFYYVLLYKLSGREDIVIGSVVEGRAREELRHIVGMFVNTLALRNYPVGEKTYRGFLKEVKARTVEAFENQEFQFDELVGRLNLERDWGYNSLFGVAFSLVNIDVDIDETADDGLVIKPYKFDIGHYPFDLILKAVEFDGSVKISLIYSTTLFKVSTARRMSEQYVEIVKQVVADREIKLRDIKISQSLRVQQPTAFKDDGTDFAL